MRSFPHTPRLALALALAACVPAVAAAPAAAQTAYVTTGPSGGIVSLDTVSGQLGAPIRLPPGPVHAAAGVLDGSAVYVAGDGGVSLVDPTQNVATTWGPLPGGAHADGIAMSPSQDMMLVASTAAGEVTPLSTYEGVYGLGKSVAVDSPTDVAIAPNGLTAYAPTAGSTLTPIDLTSSTTDTPITLDHPGSKISITPDGALALVTENDSATGQGYVQVVDLTTGTAEAPVATDGHTVTSVAVSPNGRTAYVGEDRSTSAASSAGEVVPFDIASRSFGSPLPLPSSSWGGIADLAVGADGADVFGTVPCNDAQCATGGVLDAVPATGAAARWLSNATPNIVPTQIALVPSPSATFVTAPEPTGTPTLFDATDSVDAGGETVIYDWSFGDGTSSTYGNGRESHIYTQPGQYVVSLTTTSVGGCAARFVFTGHAASCTGSPTANTRRTITVPAATPASLHAANATTGRTTAVSTAQATIHGTLGILGISTSWHFEYGSTTRYGATTPTQATAAQTSQLPVQATVTRLKPNHLYHYRLVTQTTTGPGAPTVSAGRDATFTTRANGSIRVGAKSLKVTRGAVSTSIRCVSRATCAGTLTLTTQARTGAKKRLTTITCGRATVRIRAQRLAHPRFALTKTCRTLIQRARGHRLKAKLTAQFTTGQKSLTTPVRLDG